MLQIKKLGNKNFWHYWNGNEYSASDIRIDFQGDYVQLSKANGAFIFLQEGFLYSDIEVYDVGGSAETFSSITSLENRLIELGYVAFGVSVDDVEGFDDRLDNLEENQYTGVVVYQTLADLPGTGTANVSYKVANDPTSSNNGYYSWVTSAYVKDAELNNGDVALNETDAVTGEKVFLGIEDNINDKVDVTGDTLNGYIDVTGSFVSNGGWLCTDYIAVSENDIIYYTGDTNNFQTNITGFSSDLATITEVLKTADAYDDERIVIGSNIAYIRASCIAAEAPLIVKKKSFKWTEELNTINKFTDDITGTLTNHLLNADGSIIGNASWRTTAIIEIKANDGFSFNATAFPQSPYATVIVYNSSDVIQEVIYEDDARLAGTISYAYDYKIRCCARQTGGDTIELSQHRTIRNDVEDLNSRTTQLETDFTNLNDYNRFQGLDMVNFGDSITWYDGQTLAASSGGGTGGGVLCVGYIQTVANQLGVTYDNQGSNGKSMCGNDGNEDYTKIAAYDFSTKELCTIAHGTNDFKLNRSIGTIGSITDTVFTNTTFYGAYRTALNAIIDSNQDCEIVLLTPVQRDNDSYNIEYVNSAGHTLSNYVDAIKALGEMYSCRVIDLYSVSGINFYNVLDFTIDGLHPNNNGHLKMANTVITEIR